MSIEVMKQAFKNAYGHETTEDSFMWAGFQEGYAAAISEQEQCEPWGWALPADRDYTIRQVIRIEPSPSGIAIPLYTHPAPVPAGVVVPQEKPYTRFQSAFEDGYDSGWNACRDAMLAAAPKPGEKS